MLEIRFGVKHRAIMCQFLHESVYVNHSRDTRKFGVDRIVLATRNFFRPLGCTSAAFPNLPIALDTKPGGKVDEIAASGRDTDQLRPA